jgi:predicted AAA+ superfamily ATPase
MNIKRIIENQIKHNIHSSETKNRAIILYGARQVGKTTLLKKIEIENKEDSVYFNADYLSVREAFSYQKAESIQRLFSGKKLLLIDEAQNIENIGLVLKIIVDQFPEVQVIASGSSSFELSNKINEPLTGRKYEYLLFPFSCQEVWQNKTILDKQNELELILRFGLYPEVYLEKNEAKKKEILFEISESYLYKDIFTFQDLKKPDILQKLLRLLAFQVGSEVSYQELSNTLRVSNELVQKYIFLLEQAFVIFTLSAFSRNLRKEVSKTRKVYFWDNGVLNAVMHNTNELEYRNDIGSLWGNFIISERLKFLRNNAISKSYYFWRTYDQKEIDLIEESEGKLECFEFKWSDNKKSKKPKLFLETYPNSSFKIINSNNYHDFIEN